jgi:SAM-dependent methyltransferase
MTLRYWESISGGLNEDERMTEPWMFDEVAHAGPEHLDPGLVATFDQKAGTDPVDDLAVLHQYGLDERSTVVDLGAGTGRFALAAAPRCRRVVAVDVSPAMLELLGARAAQRGLSNVACVAAGFLSYEHDGPPADVVYTRNALHHLPDFWKAVALQRVAHMLRPEGILRLRDLIFDFQPAQADAVLGRWLAQAVDDPARGYTRDDLAEHIRSEYSTFRWLLEPMLTAAGFEIVDVEFDRSTYGRYTCVRR